MIGPLLLAAATIANDEGGPVLVTGRMRYSTPALAACPPTSRGEEFLKWLGAAKSYELAGDRLFILLDLASGAAGLELEPADETTPDGGATRPPPGR